MSLIPLLNSKGVFNLSAPFDALVLDNVPYTVQSIRKLSDIVGAGEDPFEQFYEPAQLTEADYDRDLAANECIVSLQSDQGRWVYVPSYYINSYPSTGGIPYTVMAIGLNIGAIPSSEDLTAISTKLTNLIKDNLGITPRIDYLAISETQNLSPQDHAALQAARQAMIADTTTDSAKLQQALADKVALLAQLAELEQYIAQHIPP